MREEKAKQLLLWIKCKLWFFVTVIGMQVLLMVCLALHWVGMINLFGNPSFGMVFVAAHVGINFACIFAVFGRFSIDWFDQWEYRKLTYRHYREDL